MFKWITAHFRKADEPKPLPKGKSYLTKQERLQAILVSYKVGRITLERTVDLIYIWKLTSDR